MYGRTDSLTMGAFSLELDGRPGLRPLNVQWTVFSDSRCLDELVTICEQERRCMIKSGVQIKQAAEGMWKGDSQAGHRRGSCAVLTHIRGFFFPLCDSV